MAADSHRDGPRCLMLTTAEKALSTIRAARAHADHIADADKMVREPVAVVDANDDGYWADILPDRSVKVGQKLYAAPVEPVKQEPVDRLKQQDEWTPYLKDGETPFERFIRERNDMSALLSLHLRIVAENEDLKARQNDTVSHVDVDAMVNRFRGWKLPSDFSPDCGITFRNESEYSHPTYGRAKYEPVGTNLFTGSQAKAMFEYCLQGVAEPIQRDPIGEVDIHMDFLRINWKDGVHPPKGTKLYTSPTAADREKNI